MSNNNTIKYNHLINDLETITNFICISHNNIVKALSDANWIDKSQHSLYFANFGFVKFFIGRIIF